MTAEVDAGRILYPKDGESADVFVGADSKREGVWAMEFREKVQGQEIPNLQSDVQPVEKKMSSSTGRLHCSGPRFKVVPVRRRKRGFVAAQKSQDVDATVHPTSANAATFGQPADNSLQQVGGGDVGLLNTSYDNVLLTEKVADDNSVVLLKSQDGNAHPVRGGRDTVTDGDLLWHDNEEIQVDSRKTCLEPETVEVMAKSKHLEHGVTNSEILLTEASAATGSIVADAVIQDDSTNSLVVAETKPGTCQVGVTSDIIAIGDVCGVDWSACGGEKSSIEKVNDSLELAEDADCLSHALGANVEDSFLPSQMVEACELDVGQGRRPLIEVMNHLGDEEKYCTRGGQGNFGEGLTPLAGTLLEAAGFDSPLNIEVSEQGRAAVGGRFSVGGMKMSAPLCLVGGNQLQGSCISGKEAVASGDSLGPCNLCGRAAYLEKQEGTKPLDFSCDCKKAHGSSAHAEEALPTCLTGDRGALAFTKLEPDSGPSLETSQTEGQSASMEACKVDTSSPRQYLDSLGGEVSVERWEGMRDETKCHDSETSRAKVGIDARGGWLSLSGKGRLENTLENDGGSFGSDALANGKRQHHGGVEVSDKLLTLGLDLGLDVGGLNHAEQKITKRGTEIDLSGDTFWRGSLAFAVEGLTFPMRASLLRSGARNVAVSWRLVACLEATTTVNLNTVTEALASGLVGPLLQLLLDDDQHVNEDAYSNLHEIALGLLSGSGTDTAVFVSSPTVTFTDTTAETSMYILSRAGLESVLGPEGCAGLEFGQSWPVLYAVLVSKQMQHADSNFGNGDHVVSPGGGGIAASNIGGLPCTLLTTRGHAVSSAMDRVKGPAHAMELLVGINGSDSGRVPRDAEKDKVMQCSPDLFSLEMSLGAADQRRTSPTSGTVSEDSTGVAKGGVHRCFARRGNEKLDLSLSLSKCSDFEVCEAGDVIGRSSAVGAAGYTPVVKQEPIEYPLLVDNCPAKVGNVIYIWHREAEEPAGGMGHGLAKESDPGKRSSAEAHRLRGRATQAECQVPLQAAHGQDVSSDAAQQDEMDIDVAARETTVTKGHLGKSQNGESDNQSGKERARQGMQQRKTAVQHLPSPKERDAGGTSRKSVEQMRKEEHRGRTSDQKRKVGSGVEVGKEGKRSEIREQRRPQSEEPRRNDSREDRHRSRERRSGSSERRRGRSRERKHSKSIEPRPRDERFGVVRSNSKEPCRKGELCKDSVSKSREVNKRVNRESEKKEEKDATRKHERLERGLGRDVRRESAEMQKTERGGMLRQDERVEQIRKREERDIAHGSLEKEVHRRQMEGRGVAVRGRDRRSDAAAAIFEVLAADVPVPPEQLQSNRTEVARPAETSRSIGEEGKWRSAGEGAGVGVSWPMTQAGDGIVEPEQGRNIQVPSQRASDVRSGWNARHSCVECGIQVTSLRNLEDHYNGKKHKEKLREQAESKAAIMRELREVQRGWEEGYGAVVEGRQDRALQFALKGKGKPSDEEQVLNRKRARSESADETRRYPDEDVHHQQKRGRHVSPVSTEVCESPSKFSRRAPSYSPRKRGIRAPSWSPKKPPVLGTPQHIVGSAEASPSTLSSPGGWSFNSSATAHVMLENCDPMLKGWLSSDLMHHFLNDRYGVLLQVLEEEVKTAATVRPLDDLTLCLEICAGGGVHIDPLRLAKQAAYGICVLVELHDLCRRGQDPPVARIESLLREMPSHAKIDVRTSTGSDAAPLKVSAGRDPQSTTPAVVMLSYRSHVRLLCDTKQGPVDVDAELHDLFKFASEQSVPLQPEGFSLGSPKVTLGDVAYARKGLVSLPAIRHTSPLFYRHQGPTSRAGSDTGVGVSMMERKSNVASVSGARSPAFPPSHGLPPLFPPSPRAGSSPVKERRGRIGELEPRAAAALQWHNSSVETEIGQEKTTCGIASQQTVMLVPSLSAIAAPQGSMPFSSCNAVPQLAPTHAAGEGKVPHLEDSPDMKGDCSTEPGESRGLSAGGNVAVVADQIRDGTALGGEMAFLNPDGDHGDNQLHDAPDETGDLEADGTLLAKAAGVCSDNKSDKGGWVEAAAAACRKELLVANGQLLVPNGAKEGHASSLTITDGSAEQITSYDCDTGLMGQQREVLPNGSAQKNEKLAGARNTAQCRFPPLLVQNIPKSWGMAKSVRLRLEATLQETLGQREEPYISRIGFCSKRHVCSAELKTDGLVTAAIAAFEANPSLFDGLQLSRNPEASLRPQAAFVNKKPAAGQTTRISPTSVDAAGPPVIVKKEQPPIVSEEQSGGQITSTPKTDDAKAQVQAKARPLQPRALVLPETTKSRKQQNVKATTSRKRQRQEDSQNGGFAGAKTGEVGRQQEDGDSGWEPGEIPPTPTPRMEVDSNNQKATAAVADCPSPKERPRKLSKVRKTAREADEFLQSLQDVVLSPVTSPDAVGPSQTVLPFASRSPAKSPAYGPRRGTMSHPEVGRGSPIRKRARIAPGLADVEPGLARSGGRVPLGRGPGFGGVDSVRYGSHSKKVPVEAPDTIVLGQLFLKDVPVNATTDSIYEMVEDVLRMLLPNYPEQSSMVCNVRVRNDKARAWVQLRTQYMAEYVLEAYSKNKNLLQGLEVLQGHDYRRKSLRYAEADRACNAAEAVAPIQPPVQPLIGGSNRGSVKSRLGCPLGADVSFIQAGPFRVQRFRSRDEMNLEKAVEVENLDRSATEAGVVLSLESVFLAAGANVFEDFVKGVYLYVDNLNVKCAVVEFEHTHVMLETQEPAMSKCFLNIGWHVKLASRKRSVSHRFQGRIQPAL